MYEKFKRSIQPIINIYHLAKAIVANAYFGFPSKKLKVIGITGTDGKTTTTFLIYHILKSAGKKVSMISSVYANVAGHEYDTGLHTTTPDAVYVQQLLKKSKDHGDEYFVLETTSHALDQNRVYGLNFEVGVITNITSEHLDYHRTREKYIRAKAKLFLQSRQCVVNKDDDSYKNLQKILDENKKEYATCSLQSKADFTINLKKKLDIEIAEFNNYNYLEAYAVAKLLGLQEEKILKALKTFTLPKGRLEVVYNKDFKIIIDFAHTENSIRKALQSIKVMMGRGRLIHVFGAAGLRDAVKRPGMGDASGEFADVVILTEEDYRTEDPRVITTEIGEGLKARGFEEVEEDAITNSTKNKHTFILERSKAIEKAIAIAQNGDVIVLTGKSHERSLARGTKEYPYSEEEEVRKALGAN